MDNNIPGNSINRRGTGIWRYCCRGGGDRQNNILHFSNSISSFHSNAFRPEGIIRGVATLITQ